MGRCRPIWGGAIGVGTAPPSTGGSASRSAPRCPQAEGDFRDKLSPIVTGLSLALPAHPHGPGAALYGDTHVQAQVGRSAAPQRPPPSTGRPHPRSPRPPPPSLSPRRPPRPPQTHIILEDCGDDNVCVPDLRLSAHT